MNDPYVTLGVSPSATDDEVKAAYRKLAMKYHPDRNQGSKEAEAKMRQINDAYAQIMDMRKNGGRTTASGYGGSSTSGYGGYQQQRQRQQQSYGPYGYGGFGGFDDFFGFGGARQNAYRQTQWQNESPELTSAREFLRRGQPSQARSILDGMRSRSGTWYYLSALSNRALGNQAAALSDIRTAVQLDPDNLDFQDLLTRMEGPSREYEQQGSPFGGMGAAVCANPLLSCCAINILINCLCGGLRCCI